MGNIIRGNRRYARVLVFFMLLSMFALNYGTIQPTAKEKKVSKLVYSIKPSSEPYYKQMKGYKEYTKYTKHYFLITSYLRRLEEKGGGTLILKKGNYYITNVLYVPSNVTIILSDGVTIKKTVKTGTKYMTYAKSIFQLAPPSKSKKKKSIGGYNGSKNIKIIGKGSASIDLRNVEGAIGIVAGHNKNVEIRNITFKNLNSGHFLEVTAVHKMLIRNNKFMYSKASEKLNKEAINLDTPDKETKGFNIIWSKLDKTPNKNIVISNNYFYGLDRAIGTHKYSQKKDKKGKYTINMYHTNIIIKNNKINKTRSDAIRVMNWKNSSIRGNEIKNIRNSSSAYRGVLASGASNLTIMGNTFKNMPRAVQFMPIKNNDTGSIYSVIYNKLTKNNKAALKKNKVVNVAETTVRINKKYNKFDNPELIKIK